MILIIFNPRLQIPLSKKRMDSKKNKLFFSFDLKHFGIPGVKWFPPYDGRHIRFIWVGSGRQLIGRHRSVPVSRQNAILQWDIEQVGHHEFGKKDRKRGGSCSALKPCGAIQGRR